MDTYVSTGAFDALVTPFDINADWRLRNRVRAAREQEHDGVSATVDVPDHGSGFLAGLERRTTGNVAPPRRHGDAVAADRHDAHTVVSSVTARPGAIGRAADGRRPGRRH